ncbi:VOC family protein [Methylocystis parvus]|uniref:Glyoxalase n=1 Tax=Methylocystis parvus TaxID=134 RepID=A0A6B8M8I1_9HYPH|nr:VOC family protein [Methylocystis parvus]QGM98715.1 glyoxalase [Methylocystis parvus]WBK00936.1 VOC family protein [Methylocystis parvus OBBP]
MFAPQTKPRVLETALYVEDLERAGRFYRDALGLSPMMQDSRMWALDCGPASVLLLFRQGGALEPIDLPGGRIPPHDGQGPAHLAFAVEADDIPEWRTRLAACGVEIEAVMKWPRGGESLYFRDPDHHLVELASPGLWANY